MGGLGGLLGDIGRSGIAGDIINYENMRTNRAQQQWQNEQDRLTSPLKIEALRQENEMRRNAMVQAQREQAQRAEKEKYMKTPRPLDDLLGAYSQYIPEQTMGNIKRTLMKAGIAEPISGPDGQQVLMASPWKLKAGFESIPGAEKWAEQMIQAAYVENIGILKKKKEQLNEYSDPVKRMENPQKFQTLQEEVQKYQVITDKMTPFLSTEQQKFIQQKDMLEAKDQNAQEKEAQAHQDRQERINEIIRHNKEMEGLAKESANIRRERATETGGKSDSRMAMSLRKEMNALQPVKDYREITTKFDVMEKAFEESKKTNNFVAVDQALITIYNKMTDPQSVVRESEYVRTPQDMAWLNRAKAGIARVSKGGRLEPETRQAIMTMAAKFRDVYDGKYQAIANEYAGYAKQAGIDPETVVSSNRGNKMVGSGMIRVKEKATGKTGQMPANEFDPKLFDKL